MAALPSTNISTTLVANTLQVSSRNVGYLCSNQHGRTNKWSKYKPVIWNRTNVDSTPYEWYKAQDGFCGLGKATAFTYAGICDFYRGDSSSAAWEYKPPTGGANAPYRLGDFRRYDHNAEPFLRSNVKEGTVENIYVATGEGSVTFTFVKTDTGTNLQISDFNNGVDTLPQCRLCALIYPGYELPGAANASKPQEIVFGDYITEDHPAITLEFSSDNNPGARFAVFCLTYPAGNDVYIPLPYWGANDFYGCELSVRADAIPITNSIIQIGFQGEHTTIPLTHISEFEAVQDVGGTWQVGEQTFKVENRGIMQVLLDVNVDNGSTYTIYNNTQFSIALDADQESPYLNRLAMLKITQIDGAAYDGNQKSLGAGRHTILMSSLHGDLVIPDNLTDGFYYIGTLLTSAGTTQDFSWSIMIYVERADK